MLAQQVLPEAGQHKMLPRRRLGGSQAPNYVLSITGNTLIREAVLCPKLCPVFCSTIQVLLKIQTSLGGEPSGWPISKSKWRTSLVVQWLILCASTAGSMALIPSQGSSACCMVWAKKKSMNSPTSLFLHRASQVVAGMQKLRVWGGLEGWGKEWMQADLIPNSTQLTNLLPASYQKKAKRSKTQQTACQTGVWLSNAFSDTNSSNELKYSELFWLRFPPLLL